VEIFRTKYWPENIGLWQNLVNLQKGINCLCCVVSITKQRLEMYLFSLNQTVNPFLLQAINGLQLSYTWNLSCPACHCPVLFNCPVHFYMQLRFRQCQPIGRRPTDHGNKPKLITVFKFSQTCHCLHATALWRWPYM
jgi:hypothetical protein